MLPRFLTKQGWSNWHVVTALALGFSAVALTWEAWADIVRIALADEEQSHVILVPVVAVWMIGVRAVRMRNCPPRSGWIGTMIVGVGWLLSWVGYNNAIQSFWHGGAVLILIGSVLSVLGIGVLSKFLPAFVVLLLLVPIPGLIRQAISLPLQEWTAITTQAILETVAVPVERSGNLLVINGVEVAVAEACNGMRMVFALVLVSYAFAYGLPLRDWARFLVLISSPIAAMVCNVLRLIPTVLLYGYASADTAKLFHDLSGWLMLPLAFVLLLGVLRAVRWALIPVNRFTLAYQ